MPSWRTHARSVSAEVPSTTKSTFEKMEAEEDFRNAFVQVEEENRHVAEQLAEIQTELESLVAPLPESEKPKPVAIEVPIQPHIVETVEIVTEVIDPGGVRLVQVEDSLDEVPPAKPEPPPASPAAPETVSTPVPSPAHVPSPLHDVTPGAGSAQPRPTPKLEPTHPKLEPSPIKSEPNTPPPIASPQSVEPSPAEKKPPAAELPHTEPTQALPPAPILPPVTAQVQINQTSAPAPPPMPDPSYQPHHGRHLHVPDSRPHKEPAKSHPPEGGQHDSFMQELQVKILQSAKQRHSDLPDDTTLATPSVPGPLDNGHSTPTRPQPVDPVRPAETGLEMTLGNSSSPGSVRRKAKGSTGSEDSSPLRRSGEHKPRQRLSATPGDENGLSTSGSLVRQKSEKDMREGRRQAAQRARMLREKSREWSKEDIKELKEAQQKKLEDAAAGTPATPAKPAAAPVPAAATVNLDPATLAEAIANRPTGWTEEMAVAFYKKTNRRKALAERQRRTEEAARQAALEEAKKKAEAETEAARQRAEEERLRQKVFFISHTISLVSGISNQIPNETTGRGCRPRSGGGETEG